jgi:tetratricopeptide (TPR) repeat protein
MLQGGTVERMSGPDAELFEAIEQGSTNRIEQLLREGADVNARSPDGWTPLLEAARGDIAVVELLLLHRADPNLASLHGYTPLMRAAGHGCEAIVEELLAAGASLDATDHRGQSALDMAYAERFPGTAAILERALRERRQARQKSRDRQPRPAGLPGAASPAANAPAATGPAFTQHVVPVFVSSTFWDMHAERDRLRDVILPELQARLHDRNVTLELVDLRWGVDTTGLTRVRNKSMQVLKVCFAEIDRSRPYFISLIGDRYGWVPPPGPVEDAAREAGFGAPVAGLSLTELEILFFQQKAAADQRFFAYLRRALPYDQLIAAGEMALDKAATYANEFLPEPQRVEYLARREHLKDFLRRSLADRTREYSTAWNAETQSVDGLQPWQEQVLADLWAAIDADTREWERTSPRTWQQAERHALARHLATIAVQPVARARDLDELLSFATTAASSGGGWATCVTGEPGAGKSTLLASLCNELRARNVCLLAHVVGLTPRSTSVVAMYQRWTQELLAFDGAPSAGDLETAPEDVPASFWRLLRRISVDRRIVLVIDGPERFGGDDRMNWYATMASTYPSNVRVVFAADASAVRLLRHRSGVGFHELAPLDEAAMQAIASWICEKYHRRLPAAVMSEVLDRRHPNGRLAAGNPRWLAVAVEQLNLLGRESFERAGGGAGASDEERLQEVLVRTVAGFPPEIEALYDSALAYADSLDSQGMPLFAKLLALTRQGLANVDLQALLAALTGATPDAARVAFLRRGFRAHLREIPESGRYELIDRAFAAAVMLHYSVDEDEQASLHAAIASHLLGQPADSQLRARELMFHLLQAGDLGGAAKYWAQTHATGEASNDWWPAKFATEAVMDEVARRRSAGVPWLESLVGQQELTARQRGWLIEMSHNVFSMTLKHRLGLPEQQAFHGLLASLADGLGDSDDDSIRALERRLALQIENGKARFESGALTEAVAVLNDALRTIDEIRQQGGTALPATIRTGEAMAYEHLGRAFAALGEREHAVTAFEAAIRAQEELAPSGERERQVAHYLIYLGELHVAARRFQQALRCFEDAYARVEWAVDLERNERELTMSLAREREGDLRMRLDDLDGAERAYTEVRKIRRRLLDLRAGVLEIFNEGVSAEKLGDLLAKRSRLPEAREQYLAARAAFQSLVDSDPANVSWAGALANVTGLLGDLLLAEGRNQEARAEYGGQIERLSQLRRQAPEDVNLMRSHMAALLDAGAAAQALNDHDEAGSAFAAAVKLGGEIVGRDANNPTVLRNLMVAHMNVARLLTERGQLDGAIATYEEALALAGRALNLAPGDRRLGLDRAGLLWNLAQVLEDNGGSQRASELLDESLAAHDRLAAQEALPPPHDEIHRLLRQRASRRHKSISEGGLILDPRNPADIELFLRIFGGRG